MMAKRRIRILLAKPGLDGHDRGARVLARSFRDAGFEVIYTGCHQTPEQISAAAIQEDVDMVGLSCLSGAHNYLYPQVAKLLQEAGASDIVVVGGGIIPEKDMPGLYAAGLTALFTPGAKLDDINEWIVANVTPKE
jgi:methylmalonyl-CoA mutase C-terminal domain/subunit